MEYNYYFDSNNVYTHKLPATPGTLPPENALRIAPPQCKEKEVPLVNMERTGWLIMEDHRQKRDELDRIIEGTGTPYWSYEDNWYSEPHYMTAIGKLPENALLQAPQKSNEEKSNCIRSYRDSLLVSTQWLMQRHQEELAARQTTALSPETYEAYLTYRQALRDLPSLAGFPWDGDIEKAPWPEKP